ncbi:MAG: AbrB family transcriptional regulator [Treponema sp.]|jgi:membrane AbrB-like protein|nr:AbrB family transcriptional regulator [Treponema sp.]
MNWIYLLLTLLAGGVFALLFYFLKVPSGLRIGALIGAALLSVFFNAAYMPEGTQFLVQIMAGAMIGCIVERSDLERFPKIIKPVGIMLTSLLILNISAGFLIHWTSPLDWASAFMGAIPGGVTDTPIIAADMGADTAKVAILQLARYILGVGVFPPMIVAYDNLRTKKTRGGPEGALPAEFRGGVSGGGTDPAAALPGGEDPAPRKKTGPRSLPAFLCTMAAAVCAGRVGMFTGIPAGTFLFSVIGVLILKLKFDFAYVPQPVNRFAQFISGCYIGGAITMGDVMDFKHLAIPVGIVLGGYIINCFLTGTVFTRFCGFSRKEGMLLTTPAGASDIALSAMDMGVENADIVIIQIFRAVIAIAVFPQIINGILIFLQ